MKTILVLEDEPLLMKLMGTVLGRRGYHILEAACANDAFQQFLANGRQIDLLIADVSLGADSGIQVALRLRSEQPDLPVVLTSGYTPNVWSRQDCELLLRIGVDSVSILLKPFPSRILLNTTVGLIGQSGSDARSAGAG